MAIPLFVLRNQEGLRQSIYTFCQEELMFEENKEEATSLISEIAKHAARLIGEQVTMVATNDYELAVSTCEAQWQRVSDEELLSVEEELQEEYLESRHTYTAKMASHIRECFEKGICSVERWGASLKTKEVSAATSDEEWVFV